jgi:tRNA-intron endonuclease
MYIHLHSIHPFIDWGNLMPGELLKDSVLISDEKEGNQLYNKGYYGVPQSGGGLSISLIEAVYLAENDKLQVLKKDKPITLENLIRLAQKLHKNFEIRFIVYRDLRQRGYVIKMGDGVDFRVYPRGGIPNKTPSKYWVLAISERALFSLNELAILVTRVSDVRKELMLAVVDEESDITYYGVRKMTLKGSIIPERDLIKMDGLLLNDRVLVLDRNSAESLYKSEFFGRMLGVKYLQLSLIETAYLMEKGVLSIKHSKTGKYISTERFKGLARKLQKDFDIRLDVYRDLKQRGIIAKTGFKYGAHFRGYEREPDSDHARYLVHAVPEDFVSTWPEISRAVRLAHGVKKDIVFGRCGIKGVEYIGFERMRP